MVLRYQNNMVIPFFSFPTVDKTRGGLLNSTTMQENLFEMQPEDPSDSGLSDPSPDAPLAEKMRPRFIEEFEGQEHLLGPGKVLTRFDCRR